MLGWIKKIGTGTTGADGVDDPTARGPVQRDGLPGQRDTPLTSRSGQRRGSSFLAVGVMGRGSRKKDDKHNAASAAEQLDAQRAEKISTVAFKLVREIQRILKEARETQAAASSGSTSSGMASGSGSTRTPAAAPSRHQKQQAGHGSSSGANSPTPASGVMSTTSTSTSSSSRGESSSTRRNRWAGTDELLMLLNGSSPSGVGEAEDLVQRYESAAIVQAKMEDLVEQALVPESQGDLCGILLEASAGEGYHPAFVKLCVDAGLPSNLVHCLRIMRVVEFESAMHDEEAPPKTVVAEGVDGEGEAPEETDGKLHAKADTSPTAGVPTERPLTERATERIGRLLVTLCRDKSAGVGEQIKPHLPGLLSLAVSAYPPNGAHVQETARSVVEALMSGCLNSSMVWLLHYQKVSREE